MADLLGGPDWKVYRVTDYEWYVARTRDEAIATACSDWGCKSVDEAVSKDMLELDDVHELDDESLRELKYTDTDENDEPVGRARSFRTELARRVAAGLKEAELFAASEW